MDSLLLKAMCLLAAFLGLASLVATWCTRHRSESQFRQQVNSWWLILPPASLAVWLSPWGMLVLVALIAFFVERELRVFLQQAAPRAFPLTTDWLIWGGVSLCGLGALLLLAFMPGAAQPQRWIFWLFVMTALNDVGQFVAGKTLGQRKIAPYLSPNKTWEGLLGGVVTSLLLSVCLGCYLGLGETGELLIFGGLIAVTGFAGDLLFSAGKRRMGIKDYSSLIPGHGGMLDRVDSLMLTTPLLYSKLFFFT